MLCVILSQRDSWPFSLVLFQSHLCRCNISNHTGNVISYCMRVTVIMYTAISFPCESLPGALYLVRKWHHMLLLPAFPFIYSDHLSCFSSYAFHLLCTDVLFWCCAAFGILSFSASCCRQKQIGGIIYSGTFPKTSSPFRFGYIFTSVWLVIVSV